MPMLNNLIGKMGGIGTDVTAGQSDALSNLQTSLSQAPNFGGQAAGLANNLFSGGGAKEFAPMLSGAYDTLKTNFAPMLSPDFVNPYSNPAITGALDTMRSDITRGIGDKWAAAGRDLSPGHANALGRGIAAGETPVLMDQYNKLLSAQMGAAGTQFGAGTTTAAGLAGMNANNVANQLAGMGVGGAVPGMLASPGAAQLSAANTAFQQPFQNISAATGSVLPIAALGGQSTGTESKPTPSMLQQILGAGMGAAGVVGGTGGFGKNGWLGSLGSSIGGGLSSLGGMFGGAGAGAGMASTAGVPFLESAMMFSDERLKDDVRPVGMLFDETPVYSYRYKGDDTPRIGLIAQDVERDRPDAVAEIGGFKAVDYGKATERARGIGMLAMAA